MIFSESISILKSKSSAGQKLLIKPDLIKSNFFIL